MAEQEYRVASPGTADHWLYRYCQLVIGATLCLIFLGGMVTSKGAGLAVPDWPLSYGTLNPPGWWEIENVRLEHGHRIVASIVGLLTIILTIAVRKRSRLVWVRNLALGASLLVIVQGIFGGLRVTQMSIPFAIVHACTAQAFLCVLVVLAVGLSSARGKAGQKAGPTATPRALRVLTWVLVGAVFVQLIFGATMRHLEAGLAIPDFPLAFGQLVPPLEKSGVLIHFAHRVGALAVAVLMLGLTLTVVTKRRRVPRLVLPVAGLFLLVSLQILLGAYVIWNQRPPALTTFHVVNGAAVLATSLVIAMRATILMPPMKSPARPPSAAFPLPSAAS